ncbi:hypothetical protein WOLCODRAFT_89967 [Wolfiporia cocos MD-104 SS10]|uniref:Uncharacterized protein n=1 Tax=Wolfiporia cocos (strain MD-104) TaxID=742152 RepID=A0A2H3JKI1_WOLCO|nr:hypothetical protein WOLCODRAFT_89967 [Wolfiporia cocos MD-104 SS10]
MPAAPAWAQSQNSHSFQPVDHRKEYESFPASRQPFPERQGNIHANTGEPSLQTHPPAHGSAFPSISSSAGNPGSYGAASVPFHHRAEDLNDDFASDAGSTGRSHSIPNSANSSSIHLPLPEQQSRQHNYSLPGFTHVDAAHDQDAAGNHGQNNAYKTEYASGGAFGHDGQGEGGFSSAFGLMSLDDPNILAGLSSDSAPFFSNIPSSNSGSVSGMNLPTPTQDLIAALKTGKSDADSKEMRDFWKMYVRTPLSGPGSANGLALATPTGPGHMLGAGRPSPTRRHSRVASLPSMKTPPIHADVNLNAFPSINRFTLSMNDNSRNQHRRADPSREQRGNNDTNTNAFSSIRTTLHDGEDLKSYEQAVLARKAPMNLNLVPKRRGTMPASITAPSVIHQQDSDTHASKSVSPVAPHLPPPPPPPYMSNKIPDLLNRPSSTASNSSSLAHAFGAQEHAGQPQQRSRPPSQSGYEAMRPPSVASSTAVGSLSDAGTDSDSSYRPSFKRLASQTLGPDNAKRALLGPAGWDDDARTRSSGASAGQDSTQKYEAAVDRPMVGISDRHRRASCPTTGVLPGMGPGFVQPMERGEAPATGS